jgi:hypothetical protein
VSAADLLRAQAAGLAEVADDMLRASLSQGVSALDRFVHERVRTTMLSCARGERPSTTAFDKFPVPLLNSLAGATGALASDSWLNPAIVEQHSILSFQRADKIADAVRLVKTVPSGLWPSVAAELGMTSANVKDRLDLIVDRRNQIVHEDDADLSGTRAPIDTGLVTGALDFLESLRLSCASVPPVMDRSRFRES